MHHYSAKVGRTSLTRVEVTVVLGLSSDLADSQAWEGPHGQHLSP